MGDDVRPGLVLQKPSIRPRSARWAGERDPSRLARRQKVSSWLRAPSIPPAEPALHHHDGVHGAGARTGDRFDGEAPVFEEGVEHAPREGAVGPAALQGERHGLFGARPGEAAGLARMASSAARHRAVPLEVPVNNHCLGH